jgi:hypothetical protein
MISKGRSIAVRRGSREHVDRDSRFFGTLEALRAASCELRCLVVSLSTNGSSAASLAQGVMREAVTMHHCVSREPSTTFNSEPLSRSS